MRSPTYPHAETSTRAWDDKYLRVSDNRLITDGLIGPTTLL